MGKKSYLGGSTLIQLSHGGAARARRKRSVPPELQALDEMREQIRIYEKEKRNYAIINAVIEAVYEGAPTQMFDIEAIEEVSISGRLMGASRARSTLIRSDDEFDLHEVKSHLRVGLWGRDSFRSLKVVDAQGRSAVAIYCCRSRKPSLVGYYPDDQAFRLIGARGGWVFVASEDELAALPEEEVRTIWSNGVNAPRGDFWK